MLNKYYYGLFIVCLAIICIIYDFSNNGYAKYDYVATLSGFVFDDHSHLPIPHANISIEPIYLQTSTNSNGFFSIENISIPNPTLPITITISSDKYAQWQLSNVPLISNDTLMINSRLSHHPYNSRVAAYETRHISTSADSLYTQDDSFTESAMPLIDLAPLPQYIRVRVSGYPYSPCDVKRDYTVEIVDFKDYVKHVLPNEWNPRWHSESLRAGAIATKMYAWYWVALGGKWKDADVWDNVCDQVYNPNFSYASTNEAVDFTWNWALLRNNMLLHTSYRATNELCIAASLEGNCLGQKESNEMALAGYTWDEILSHFYYDSLLDTINPPPLGGYSLRFNGTIGDYNENRVLVSLENNPPINIGSGDFTIEWWMKNLPGENNGQLLECGNNNHWMFGNIILDKSHANGLNGYGISLLNGRVAFGVQGNDLVNYTLCGKNDTRDSNWHHIAIQRRFSDGYLWIYLDGKLESSTKGPLGDVSYPINTPSTIETDPYISIGAWKLDNDHTAHPFYRGWIDEMRFSNTLRYSSNFTIPPQPFTRDEFTVAIFHFDEGIGNLVIDSSGAIGGPSHGIRKYGGTINGPEWVLSDLFHSTYIPIISK